MGYRVPPQPGPPPDRESFHLGMARSAYLNGELTIEEFERSVEHVLRGGHLNHLGRIPADLYGRFPSALEPTGP